MTVRRTVLLVLVLLLAVALVPPAAAAGHGIYISLGDSVPAGYAPGVAPEDYHGYPDVLYKRIGDEMGLTEHINLACPGEDSSEMLSGDGSYCYSTAFTQMDAAMAVIAADPGAVKLITITIGANDVLACTSEPDVTGCIAGVLPVLGGNLVNILTALRTATYGYDVPIIGMNYYNPLMAYQLSDDAGLQALAEASSSLVYALNTMTLEAAYGAFGVPVADVERKFKTLDTSGAVYPRNLRYICKATNMCEKTDMGLELSDWSPDPGVQADIHPNRNGHGKIAAAFIKAMEKAGLI